MVLGRHSTTFLDPETGQTVHSEGFIYSCKALLMNMKRQVDGCGDQIALFTDTTFNLLYLCWFLYSVGCRTWHRVGETLRQKYRPFCFLVSRTERGDGYWELFRTLEVVRPRLGIEKYEVLLWLLLSSTPLPGIALLLIAFAVNARKLLVTRSTVWQNSSEQALRRRITLAKCTGRVLRKEIM
jgi:hypothetical protein